tara:strand:+ start:20 stop:523 length:504 start_codon:yes stop_codon:yes gene_type:complete
MIPVFLIGYMGSGKSTIGKELSKMMGLSFFDLDVLIEEEIDMTIAELFHEKGEDFFRKKEHDILTNYNFNSCSIIATGGGAPCFFDNQYFMNSIGYTIYLKISCHELTNRLKRDQKRPLLYNQKLNLKEFVSQQISERKKYYENSHSIIESDNILISQVQEIVNQIR